mgnify:CR=1 FL=1|jgi:hypothetical protein|tara:strand:- start:9722 stop:10312 length:591 start_codon:yes stop_codon:yes gene_type:complete
MEVGLEFGYALAALVSSLATIATVWFKGKIKERKNKVFNYDPNLHSNVMTALEYMQAETEADRVYILEFHNGEHYFSGRSQQKFSCTYEVVNEGISREVQGLQNIRVSSMHYLIKDLVEGKTFLCKDVDEFCEDLSFKSFMEMRGIKSMFARPIKTLNGKIIGVLVMDFVKDYRTWGDNAEEFLSKQTKIISGYLA